MRLRLRVRVAIAFALMTLLVSVALAIVTYQVARVHLVSQREALVVRQAGLNALAFNSAVGAPDADVSSLLASLPGSGSSREIARIGSDYYSSSVATGAELVPRDVVDTTERGQAVTQLVQLNGEPTVVVGVPLKSVQGEYFEVASLTELQRTLSTLAWSLTAATAVAVAIGAALGTYASRRVLRPLREFSQASAELGTGHFDTRLSIADDPDLAPLAAAFNDMAQALEHRIERDTRFASDVSHELRNPLTALSAAVDVLEARVDARTLPALEVLRTQVSHFRQLVLDLLELSRLDSGRDELVLRDVDIRKCVAATVAAVTGAEVDVVVAENVPKLVRLDERRVERTLANLLDNAERHGGAATRVEVSAPQGFVQFAVEDAGPGVPDDERNSIFDRFHRVARREHDATGSGLGLAIVAEHCRAHGGWVRLEASSAGGARFVAAFREGDLA